MPYNKVTDLPYQVYNALPPHGREIWLNAFNKAFSQHGPSDEVLLFRIAWRAVKRLYHKPTMKSTTSLRRWVLIPNKPIQRPRPR